MIDIDYVMNLLDWNNSIEKQAEGIKLAHNIKCINIFLQPGYPYGKRVWENCAKILSERTNEELSPYLLQLMTWLQDMNWPGAFCILDRLEKMVDEEMFRPSYNICIKCARAIEYEEWEFNLEAIENGCWSRQYP